MPVSLVGREERVKDERSYFLYLNMLLITHLWGDIIMSWKVSTSCVRIFSICIKLLPYSLTLVKGNDSMIGLCIGLIGIFPETPFIR